MINVLKSRNHSYYFLFMVLLNIMFTKENYQEFTLTIPTGLDTLSELYFSDTITKEDIKKCDGWVPSLFNPILLVPTNIIISEKEEDILGIFRIISPVININEEIDISLFRYKLFTGYDLFFAKVLFNDDIIHKCYFGLCPGIVDYNINENDINLNMMKKDLKIEQKIFSFDKWNITDNSINTFLYLGDRHENFNSKTENIGSCTAYKNDSYWGCSFKKMNFNNNIIELNKDNNEEKYYSIYFSSENHFIIFPESFKNKFNLKTNSICEEDKDSKLLYCNNLFDSKNYIPIKLINDNMNITLEVDNLNRFCIKKDDQLHKTRIKFEKVDYFIFPLIMFKNFHVQFDLENNIISFYTTEPGILELPKKEKEDNSQDQENHSSNIGTILLIIFIILLILALGFGVFWFIKKRRDSSEKNINKYNKFEEDENFQNMNEKVF